MVWEILTVPLHRLKELFPGIRRFTAMAVTFSYHPDSPDELRVSLIKRNGTESSWGNTWERAGGTPDEGDPTIIHSATRESKEEIQTRPLRIAGKAFTCSFYHKYRETGDIVLMRTRGFIAIDHEVTRDNGETIKNENTMAQRIWSGKMQQAAGHSSVKISDEHLDHCWFTEYEVRSAALYEQDTPQGPFATLRAKRDTVLLAFELFSQSQGQKLPPSRDIVR
ncbi:hypothetical protein N7472_010733 [Penicillium cf. griseofulvum]|uniref:Nudix hydrolase domain-containing protein n=1 Tax=Penicillium cf. griseofulvum TaxID=2972120 RepID=A0A9W9IVN0_9EURO|nr:hypothetical protein N7472_010733 [Penicillium cf. griseofulvum]KAJ5436988.1 hypothetical protein N7445_007873 [Penicillium cf. griseofulvum]